MVKFNSYPNFASLSDALSQQWLNLITLPQENRLCSFALAGGVTPKPLYRHFDSLLAKTPPPNFPIRLVATDERWVSDADAQSNEGLLRCCLTTSASRCQLLSLKTHQANPASAVSLIDKRIQQFFPDPFSAVILGMGTDGHIASLFPGAPDLLLPADTRSCVASTHPQTQQMRISLSLARLLNTSAIWIVIKGEEKRTVFGKACTERQANLPISALLTAARCDVNVFWCP